MTFDITERKGPSAPRWTTKPAARRDRQLARTGVLSWTPRSHYLREQCRARVGHEPDAVMGRTVRDVVGELFYAEIGTYLARALRGERVEFESSKHRAWDAARYAHRLCT